MLKKTPTPIFTARFTSPVGLLEVIQSGDKIARIARAKKGAKDLAPTTPLLRRAKRQLDSYFSGQLKKFQLPLEPPKSDFDEKVWKALHKIPFGQTLAYSDLAQKIKNPKAMRAVGGACGRNPHMIVVPCHRILAKNRRIGGFSGGAGVKEALLQHEGIDFV